MAPKKGKKGKKGEKGKKGKKKNAEKEESVFKQAERNSNIWEARLRMTEFQKEHYKDTARQFAEENTSLVDTMRQTEKDTIDVVNYLRKMDAEKESENARLTYELKVIHLNYQAQKEAMINDFTMKLNECEAKLSKKTDEAELLQNELNQLKEFRKKKIQMQKELEEIKEAMILNEKEHKEHMERVEQKFFEEKMRLQIEANKKIEELAERAHDAAVKNLDEITRNVYKENLQLAESFKINAKELDNVKKVNKLLAEENEKLKGYIEDNGALVKDRVEAANKQAKQIKDLQSKVEVLEKSLAQVVREFELERSNIMKTCKIQLESSATEIDKLTKTLEMKAKEMNKVKKLAKNILDQRSEIERFFLDSLDYVRKQIVTNRAEYRKVANAAYNSRMLAAFSGQGEYPKIRTFSKKFDAHSTNNVYKDLEEAGKWYDLDKLVDLAELTWEQKEQVLRELFARMNGAKVKRADENDGANKLALAKIKRSSDFLDRFGKNDDDNDEDSDSLPPKNVDFTFLTNAQPEDLIAKPSLQDSSKPSIPKLPSISHA